MSSIDDSSFISGISNISRISKVNNSTLNKYDSTCNLLDWRSCRDVNRSFIGESQKSDQRRVSESTKINKALSFCEESTCDYAIMKLIYECLEEMISDKNYLMKKDTLKKLRELIIVNKVKKFLHLPNNSKDLKEELTLLGIVDLPKHEFSYEEQLAIKSSLEAKMREKIRSFLKVYENSTGSTAKELVKNNDSLLRTRFQQKEELDNMHWKDKIDEVCVEYKRELHYCHKMLNNWNDMKSKMYEKNIKDAENLLLQAEIAETKVIITKLSCTLRMYQETPATIDAFKMLNDSLDKKIAEVSEEIAEKTELKRAYDALSNTQYDEILRKYLELCHIIKKKKSLLEKL